MQLDIVKLRVLSHVLVNSWFIPGQVYKTLLEDPKIGSVMGWPTHPQTTQLFLSWKLLIKVR